MFRVRARLRIWLGLGLVMGDGRIFYVGGKVGAKPRAWGAKKNLYC